MSSIENSNPCNKISVSHFFLHPARCADSLFGKVMLVALSIFVGIISFGIVHSIAYLAHRFSKEVGPAASNVTQAAEDTLPKAPQSPNIDVTQNLLKETISMGSDSSKLVGFVQNMPPDEEPIHEEQAKFFHTIQDPKIEGNPGDYSLTEINKEKGILKMSIKGTDGKFFDVLVRRATSQKGYYRLLIPFQNKGMIQSAIPFTFPQISGMMNCARTLPPGFRISSLSKITYIKTGLIIFSKDLPAEEKGHYIVNTNGALQKVEEKVLLSMLGKIIPK